jgi:hypothetical protein
MGKQKRKTRQASRKRAGENGSVSESNEI